jgi:hypothetical protein
LTFCVDGRRRVFTGADVVAPVRLQIRRSAGRLWQPQYYDHVLRDEEDTLRVARYIIVNPVRAGLVTSPRDYPFSGSDVMPLETLLEDVAFLDR